MNNVASVENVARDDASERQTSISAAAFEWHQEGLKLDTAISSLEAQIGGQQGIVGEQSGMLLRAKRYVADLDTRAQVEVAATRARQNAENQRCVLTARDEQSWCELGGGHRAVSAKRAAAGQLTRALQAAEMHIH